ncbi:MAG TPA: hypothetical protein EYO31_09585, partial [Phycisphaerales bacterium]|nr:hypothetical protein [Phycisphaerales bacterium]
TESIKWLEEFSAPILILIGILLISWGAYNANGFGIVLDQSEQLEKPEAVITYEGSIDQYVLNLNPLRNKEGFIKASYFQLSTEGNTSIGPDAERWMQFNRHKLNILLNEFDPDVNWEDVMNGEKQVGIQFRADGDDKFDFIYSSVVPVQVSSESATTGSKMWSYIMWLTIMVGFWATMSLSIADITRYASSQKDQVKGQFIGLPGTMILFSFVGVFVTCAAVINFKDILIASDAPWDPVSLLSKFESPTVVVISQIFMLIATLSTNIAANVIAPANAFSNLFPKSLSFRGGGMVTAIIGIIICPWWLLNEISGILIFVSGLLGPVLGILLCDYYVINKKTLQLAELYKTQGVYSFGGSGFNKAAMIALAIGVGTAVIGYWVPVLYFLYNLSW